MKRLPLEHIVRPILGRYGAVPVQRLHGRFANGYRSQRSDRSGPPVDVGDHRWIFCPQHRRRQIEILVPSEVGGINVMEIGSGAKVGRDLVVESQGQCDRTRIAIVLGDGERLGTCEQKGLAI